MSAPLLLHHRPAPPLAEFVASITAYSEGAAPQPMREAASLDVPVIVTFAGGFRIALDQAPTAADRYASFAAGLHPGFVAIEAEPGTPCLQLTFTPLGARLALGLPLAELAGRMVPLADLGLPAVAPLACRLADLPGWPERLAAAEAWAAARIRAGLAAPPAEAQATAAAYRLLRRSSGAPRIGALADRLGRSRRQLARGFREEFGAGPKTVARILRFMRADRLARAAPPDWSDIDAACGYSDQAHLSREFRILSGSTPTVWLARGSAPA